MDSNCVAVVSGGLDSTTLVYDLIEQGYAPFLLSFNYGQRHHKELSYADMTAERLDLEYYRVDLTGITELISNSALTSYQPVEGERHGSPDGTYCHCTNGAGHTRGTKGCVHEIPVPEGHYAEDNMKLTVVPNRNMIMLSIAVGLAVSRGLNFVATGVHAGDHYVYPDCRPRFINAFAAAAIAGNQGFGKVPEWPEGESFWMGENGFVRAPYIFQSKADIAYRALELNVPLHETWSCYRGGEVHCGRCGTCVERLEAIAEAQQRFASRTSSILGDFQPVDATEYADTEYWKAATK